MRYKCSPENPSLYIEKSKKKNNIKTEYMPQCHQAATISADTYPNVIDFMWKKMKKEKKTIYK